MLSLILTIVPIVQEPTLCTEIWYELDRAVQEELITQKQADDVYQRCLLFHT